MMADPFEIARQGTLEEVKQTANETKTTIGDIGDPAGEESLVGLIKNIPETVPTGAVKSVQRGTYRIVNGDSNQNKIFSISTVNPEKCMVILDVSNIGYKINNLYGSGCYLVSLDSNNLTVHIGNIDQYNVPYDLLGSLSWQVIEFY